LQRREAIRLFREIVERSQDLTLVEFVVLRQAPNQEASEDFQLHIKAKISDATHRVIELIAEKNQLGTMEAENYIILFSPVSSSSLQLVA
jgi:hypothetical protein